MLYKPLIVAALALLIVQSFAQELVIVCNTSGVEGSCGEFVTTFCTSLADLEIPPADTAGRCFTSTITNLKCDFTVVNVLTAQTSIDVANCEAALTAVNTTCLLGGSGHFIGGNFQFFADPNTGACGPPCGN